MRASWRLTLHANSVIWFTSAQQIKTFRASGFRGSKQENDIMTIRRFGIELEVSGGSMTMSAVARLINAAGVDINVEGYNHQRRRSWKIVSDGSLSGSNMMELVSPPLRGNKKGMAQVATVAQVLANNGITVNSSCGMHVHVDGANLTTQHLKNVAKLIAIHEEHIKWILPPSRRVTRWAQWPSDIMAGGWTVEKRVEAIDACHSASDLMNLWGRDRYRAVNFESLSRHNTIEFRSHSGTVDAMKIMAWTALCLGIVRNAARDYDVQRRQTCGRLRHFTNLIRYAGKDNLQYFHDRRQQFSAAPVQRRSA